jgi:transposase-like protein
MFMRHKWLGVSWARCVLRDMRWRFTLSYRDVEDLLAERALDVSYETVRRWVLKFGPVTRSNQTERRFIASPVRPALA